MPSPPHHYFLMHMSSLNPSISNDHGSQTGIYHRDHRCIPADAEVRAQCLEREVVALRYANGRMAERMRENESAAEVSREIRGHSNRWTGDTTSTNIMYSESSTTYSTAHSRVLRNPSTRRPMAFA